MKLTVIIRNDAPMVLCGDSPSYRTVVIDLTKKQKQQLELRETYRSGKIQYYEDISKAILEFKSE